MGRKVKVVAVSMPEEIYIEAEEARKSEGKTRSRWVLEAITEKLDEDRRSRQDYSGAGEDSGSHENDGQ